MHYTATYSPEDNKLRLYATARLPADVYERVRAAGFKWAPKQELFFAPAWTPDREDLLIELAGAIDDEDTSLVERAEERAERFEDYRDKRAADADRAHAAVHQIADGIPLGQPILVGHHSERRARKDAEKIESGMRKAVLMWETAKYWTDRAAGAIRHAKFKELPPVRARRIKTIEADKRKQEREKTHLERLLRFWSGSPTKEKAVPVCNAFDHGGVMLESGETYWSAWGALTDGTITVEALTAQRLERLPNLIAYRARWIAHYENRLAYERAMLGEAGGIATDRTKPEKGGACRCWASPGRFGGASGRSIIRKVNRVSVTIEDNWGNGGKNFTRTIPFDQLKAVMSKAEVDAKRAAGLLADSANGLGFFLLDAPIPTPRPAAEPDAQAAKFETLKETLQAGVKVVSAPNLFPTPEAIADQIALLADIRDRHRVLEPSAGTGALLAALPDGVEVIAVELVCTLAEQLARRFPNVEVKAGDFLTMNGDLGTFDRIVMNPPFDHGADIEHVRHALTLLNPGGRLVAIVANGPRQREEMGEICSGWIDLPPGAFKEQGTNVNAAIVVIDG